MITNKTAPEKSGTESIDEEHSKKALTLFAIWLSLTIVIAGILDYSFSGMPLQFGLHILNIADVTVSLLLYYTSVLTTAVYIGIVGLKELFIERHFNVEFLMAIAGLGALYLRTCIQ
jgi:cation transport ATPase